MHAVLSLKFAAKSAAIAALMITFLAPPPAQAFPCKLERNASGMWVGDCYLKDIFGEELVVERALSDPPAIRLPDLYADDGDYYVNGNAVQIEVRTGNNGQRASGDFDVTATVTVSSGGNVMTPINITARVNGIDVGTRTRTVLGTIFLPDRVSDWDVQTTFTVDSSGMTSGGEIWELNEMNNTFNDGTCRVYGANPDTSVEPCQ